MMTRFPCLIGTQSRLPSHLRPNKGKIGKGALYQRWGEEADASAEAKGREIADGIKLVAIVPTLSVAAIISRNLYKKTGNIWMAGCLNALLMTTMTIENTMVAFK